MPAINVVETRFEEIVKLLKKFANRHNQEITRLGMETEDFIQDVCMNILTRKGLDQYDEEKVQSFDSLIFLIAKRQLIDAKRNKGAKSRQGLEINIDQPICDKDGDEVSLHDILPDENAEMAFLVVEMIESAPATQISPNYRLTWKELARMTFSMSPKEIANEIGISESRVSQLQKECHQRFWHA